jgi:hypothetical protein
VGEAQDEQRQDPSALTTAQTVREIAALKELITTRLEAMDKAIVLFSDNLTRVPTDVDKQVGNLKELHDERFSRVATQIDAIQRQFTERDGRVKEAIYAAKIALDDALLAAKEIGNVQNQASALAILKSETATAKQLDQIGFNLQTIQAALHDKIDDVKTRLTSFEGRGQGIGSSWGVLATIAGIVIAGLAIFFSTRSDTPKVAAPQVIVLPPVATVPSPVIVQPAK